jgi:hypothetical protein
MKIIINENQIDQLKVHIQNLIDSELGNLREESMEWGLGEMNDYEELSSVNKIVVDRIVPHNGIKVYVDFYVNDEEREDYNNIRAEIQYRISEWVPNVKIFFNDIISYEI